MSNKILVVIAVVVLIVVGIFLFQNNSVEAPVKDEVDITNESSVTDTDETKKETETKEEEKNTASTVIYTSSGYLPAILEVEAGTVVTFQNESSKPMWTASDAHPTHGAYPIAGGCIGSVFDSCEEIPAGGSWSFTFDKTGTWGYHNHSKSGDTGKIIVK